jgi:hypothetical protein
MGAFASHRAAMRCGGMRKVGIERRRDASHQEFCAVADGKPIVDHRYGAVGDEAFDPRPTDGKPNDIDHYEGRFAVEDTRKAVREARRLRHRRQHPSIASGASSDLPAIGPLKRGRIRGLPRCLPGFRPG